MIAVIFEVLPAEGQLDDYMNMAAVLRPELEQMDGFISIERFQSLVTPGKILSLSFWRDEQAVMAWRCHGKHRRTQAMGRSDTFSDYRLRVAHVLRDYGMTDRAETPDDSGIYHGSVKGPGS